MFVVSVLRIEKIKTKFFDLNKGNFINEFKNLVYLKNFYVFFFDFCGNFVNVRGFCFLVKIKIFNRIFVAGVLLTKKSKQNFSTLMKEEILSDC